ncbi:SOS response-associated peptidase [Bacillus sp. REN3]|uniref:SOS response-associated peptidase n=1 Tax=Bacillus sp. REN3 TaxID=2802440 RepID=UPI001AEE8C49|nr:SOS response-associated peptidase [Bacillus sp. REN3]
MCGRFSLFESIGTLRAEFNFEYNRDYEPRYNIAPGQDILAVVSKGKNREGFQMRWGLVPFWADDEKIGFRMINARAETIDRKSSFSNAFRKRHCLILADGFYEWQKEENHKRPYRFEMKDKQPFAFAGLWENWQKEGKRITSCTIITTEANRLIERVHERMPVILPADKHDFWLDGTVDDVVELKRLLQPIEAEEMEGYEISTAINLATNEGKGLITPIDSI